MRTHTHLHTHACTQRYRRTHSHTHTTASRKHILDLQALFEQRNETPQARASLDSSFGVPGHVDLIRTASGSFGGDRMRGGGARERERPGENRSSGRRKESARFLANISLHFQPHEGGEVCFTLNFVSSPFCW